MPTTPRSRRTSLLAVLLLALVASGCGVLGDDGPEAPAPSSAAPPDVAASLQRVLDRRTRALVDGDRGAFDTGLAADPRFRRNQGTYFENLRRLPVALLDVRVDPATLVRDGRGYWVVVQQRLQLEGYDAAPVVSLDRYRFVPARRPGRFLLASVTDPEWERENEVLEQPWESGPVEVRTAPGVLGVLDAAVAPDADELLADASAAAGDVAAAVPYDWPQAVVLYALSDTDFLDSLTEVPGGDPEDLDAVAFPLPAGTEEKGEAATRVVLNPRVLDRDGVARDRLLRHEITHVALGAHDDQAPLWLQEGLAEYVSVGPLPLGLRRPSQQVLDAAHAGFSDLPPEDGFHGDDAPIHYALSWWACEYLAAEQSEDALWRLLDAYADPTRDPEQVLHDTVGLWPRDLARAAGELLVRTFDPPMPRKRPASPTPASR